MRTTVAAEVAENACVIPLTAQDRVMNLYKFIRHLGKQTGTKNMSESCISRQHLIPPKINSFDDFMNFSVCALRPMRL